MITGVLRRARHRDQSFDHWPCQCRALGTHHGTVGLHIGMLWVGVLGVQRDHHLVRCLVPVIPACHLFLVLQKTNPVRPVRSADFQ